MKQENNTFDHCKILISKNCVGEALKILLEETQNDEIKHSIILKQSELHRLEQEKIDNTISIDNKNIIMSQISKSILDIIKKLEEQSNSYKGDTLEEFEILVDENKISDTLMRNIEDYLTKIIDKEPSLIKPNYIKTYLYFEKVNNEFRKDYDYLTKFNLPVNDSKMGGMNRKLKKSKSRCNNLILTLENSNNHDMHLYKVCKVLDKEIDTALQIVRDLIIDSSDKVKLNHFINVTLCSIKISIENLKFETDKIQNLSKSIMN